MFIGSLMMGISPFFIGPDTTFTGLHSNLWITFPALALTGFSAAYLLI